MIRKENVNVLNVVLSIIKIVKNGNNIECEIHICKHKKHALSVSIRENIRGKLRDAKGNVHKAHF